MVVEWAKYTTVYMFSRFAEDSKWQPEVGFVYILTVTNVSWYQILLGSDFQTQIFAWNQCLGVVTPGFQQISGRLLLRWRESTILSLIFLWYITVK